MGVQFDLDDDFEDDDSLVGDGAIASGVSYEFSAHVASGLDPFCWSPWRMLKVDIRCRTSVCCNFAHKLPRFEWPDARSFHSSDGMWNHPYMQHMRARMGRKDEAPYCTFCRTKDKRDPDNADERKAAIKANQVHFERVTREASNRPAQAGIGELPDDLSDWGLKRRPASAAVKPFSRDKAYYRRLVRLQGFADLDDVLQLGASQWALTPFLAETARSLTVADTARASLSRLPSMTEAIRLSNIVPVHLSALLPLPFADGSFSGVWLDGRVAAHAERGDVLRDIARVLRPAGRLYVSHYPGPGALVEGLAEAPERAAAVRDALSEGPARTAAPNFLTVAAVGRALKGTGLDLDRATPPRSVLARAALPGRRGRELSAIAAAIDDGSIWRDLEHTREMTRGLERMISFAALKPAR